MEPGGEVQIDRYTIHLRSRMSFSCQIGTFARAGHVARMGEVFFSLPFHIPKIPYPIIRLEKT